MITLLSFSPSIETYFVVKKDLCDFNQKIAVFLSISLPNPEPDWLYGCYLKEKFAAMASLFFNLTRAILSFE